MKKSKTTIRTYMNIYNKYLKGQGKLTKEDIKKLVKLRLALSGKNKWEEIIKERKNGAIRYIWNYVW